MRAVGVRSAARGVAAPGSGARPSRWRGTGMRCRRVRPSRLDRAGRRVRGRAGRRRGGGVSGRVPGCRERVARVGRTLIRDRVGGVIRACVGSVERAAARIRQRCDGPQRGVPDSALRGERGRGGGDRPANAAVVGGNEVAAPGRVVPIGATVVHVERIAGGGAVGEPTPVARAAVARGVVVAEGVRVRAGADPQRAERDADIDGERRAVGPAHGGGEVGTEVHRCE